MSSSRSPRRRILRSGDGVQAPAASILVEVPGSGLAQSPGGPSLADMLEQARMEGREEGYRAATTEMQAAEAAGRAAQLRRVADAIVEAAARAGEARREAVTLGAAEAADLAYDLAEAFLRRELLLGRAGLDAVVRALALVPEEEDLVVRLNPSEPVSAEELAELAPDVSVKLVADPRVEAGGCVIQAGPCRIDTQLGAALQRVRDVLAEVYPDTGSGLAVVQEDVA